MTIRGLLTITFVLTPCLSTIALANTIIDFAGITDTPLFTYTEAGFTVTSIFGNWEGLTSFGHPPPFIWYLSPGTGTGTIAVTQASTPFTFQSVDFYSSVTPIPYVFTGFRN